MVNSSMPSWEEVEDHVITYFRNTHHLQTDHLHLDTELERDLALDTLDIGIFESLGAEYDVGVPRVFYPARFNEDVDMPGTTIGDIVGFIFSKLQERLEEQQ